MQPGNPVPPPADARDLRLYMDLAQRRKEAMITSCAPRYVPLALRTNAALR
jgi:hypothetical protein